MEQDFGDLSIWRPFMRMLSVERTEVFLSELALPIQQENYHQVMRLARACGEAYMFPSIRRREAKGECPNLIRFWQRYREQEGVLSDDALQEYADDSSQGSRIYAVYNDFQNWIGKDTAEALKSWRAKYCPPIGSIYFDWVFIFCDLLGYRSGEITSTTPPPIDDVEQKLILDFCSFEMNKGSELNRRFDKLEEIAISGEPTAWERVLQTFPASCDEGAGLSYYWLLHDIPNCLSLKTFREEWGKLRDKLGHDKTAEFLAWAKQEAVSTLKKQDLPDELGWRV